MEEKETNSCDCHNHVFSFNVTRDFFQENYKKFMNTKSSNITSPEKLENVKKNYDTLLEVITGLKSQGENCVETLSKCSYGHQQQINEINYIIKKLDTLKERINKHLSEIKNNLPKFESQNELNYQNDVNINYINDNNNKENMREILENDNQQLMLVINALDTQQIQKQYKDQLKEIIQIKNNLKEIMGNIQNMLQKSDEELINIEENVNNAYDNVEKGNDELKSAAKSAVSRRRIKYQVGLTTLGIALGTVVPGLGNVIGGIIGAGIGTALYKVDKYRLDKIDKK